MIICDIYEFHEAKAKRQRGLGCLPTRHLSLLSEQPVLYRTMNPLQEMTHLRMKHPLKMIKYINVNNNFYNCILQSNNTTLFIIFRFLCRMNVLTGVLFFSTTPHAANVYWNLGLA